MLVIRSWWLADIHLLSIDIPRLLLLTETAPHNSSFQWRLVDNAQTIDIDHISTLFECKHYKL